MTCVIKFGRTQRGQDVCAMKMVLQRRCPIISKSDSSCAHHSQFLTTSTKICSESTYVHFHLSVICHSKHEIEALTRCRNIRQAFMVSLDHGINQTFQPHCMLGELCLAACFTTTSVFHRIVREQGTSRCFF